MTHKRKKLDVFMSSDEWISVYVSRVSEAFETAFRSETASSKVAWETAVGTTVLLRLKTRLRFALLLVPSMLSPRVMNPRQLLKRLFKSRRTQILGGVLIALELLTVAAAVVTGDWSLPLFFPLLAAFFLFRAILFAFLFLSPILILVIIVWAAVTHSKEKQEEKANRETSKGEETTTSGPAL